MNEGSRTWVSFSKVECVFRDVKLSSYPIRIWLDDKKITVLTQNSIIQECVAAHKQKHKASNKKRFFFVVENFFKHTSRYYLHVFP